MIRRGNARSILSKVSGFLAEAGFTHSLTPARNCTFGCTYCYVPTMRLQGGLQPEDWQRWGQFTTFKSNAAQLLPRELRAGQRIYCSPLVDPYQPAEESEALMPQVLRTLLTCPRAPGTFVIQTRGPLILRDLPLLREVSQRLKLRVSFSLTTNREEIRRLYEPLCAGYEERLRTLRSLAEAGIETHATLAPLLPCDPENLMRDAISVTGRDVIGDPLHVRAVKPRGATTREAAFRIRDRHGHQDWFDPSFQARVVESLEQSAAGLDHRFLTGPPGFALLAL